MVLYILTNQLTKTKLAAVIGCLVNIPRKNREFRVINLNESLNDEELRRRFRFGRIGIVYLADLLREDLARETDRSCSLSVEEQVCIALRYYASGSFMQVVGDTHGRHKSTVCRVVDKVTKEIVKRYKQYIKWPVDEATMRRVKSEFSNIAGFPGVIGCVDGSLVRLIKPSPDQERGFINRKGFPSINVMALRKTPAKASEVIVACAVLHNIAIMVQEPDVPDDENDDGADAQIPYTGRETGFLIRDHLAQVYF
ncbi:putative nuclease HARBI1 [Mya arenaria]|uniref:putative nuclease HARBI1 n=1 Tax=Mya arenaria TaxID=6604 RepID=UPI0022E0CE9A|nr:putative nuclease HARBI1 [Mya arenaria]